jgi:tyrosine-protein kinase Etk/Wzc
LSLAPIGDQQPAIAKCAAGYCNQVRYDDKNVSVRNLTVPTQPEGSERVLSEAERDTGPNLTAPAEEEISLLDLLIVIARRRRLIARTVFGLVLAAVIISLLLPKRYTATTSILPPQQNSSNGAALMGQLGSLGSVASLATGSLGLKNPNDLQVAFLKSETVENEMVDRFHLQQLYHVKRKSDARKKLENAVEIDSGSKDGLIHISVTDGSPQRASEMANAYVDEYKRFSSTMAVSEASQRRLFFEQQLSQAKDNLGKAEEDLKRTEQQTGLIQLDGQAQALIQSVSQLHAQIAAKEVQIRAMRSFATGENPDLQVAEEELAGLQAQDQKMGATSEGSFNALLIPKGKMQESSLIYVRKLRDVKYYQTIFDLLARQYEAAKIDEAREGALIQVVDPATIPDHRSSPKRTYIVLGAAVFGMLIGVGWAFAAEGYTRLSNDPAERSRLETLGTLLSRKKRERQV